MNAKKGFHWKLIEDKPDNWETLQILIQSSYIDKPIESSSSWTKNIILEIFIQLYPEMKKYIKINSQEEKNNQLIKSKKYI